MDCKTQNISLKRADAAFIAHISKDYYKFTLTATAHKVEVSCFL